MWRGSDGTAAHLHVVELVGTQSLAGRGSGCLGPFENERRAAGAQLLAFSRVLSEIAGRADGPAAAQALAEGRGKRSPKVTPVRRRCRSISLLVSRFSLSTENVTRVL